jgi:cystathionine beta-lyase/cystathionine gamma-synthase
MNFATKAIRVGQTPNEVNGAVVVPIYQSANFVFKGVAEPNGFEYSRVQNPTRLAYEQCLASLEGATCAMAFSSGMAAADTAMSLLRPGEHVIASKSLYGGTYRLFDSIMAPRGISYTYVDGTRPAAFEEAIVAGKTKMIWIETPANPLLELVDVRAVAATAKKHGLLLAADNTFSSPYLQRPLEQGADIVVHSTTKFINGHSDVVGGAIVTNSLELDTQLRFYQTSVGAIPGAFDCWLSLRGLKTLAVRMRQHEHNANVLARWLNSHPKAQRVVYPGLESHPQHELAKSQMDGFGAMIAFELEGGVEAVKRFIDGLEVFLFAESLGGVESLICHPWTMSHGAMADDVKRSLRISEGSIRLSVGIEDPDDLIADLDKAFRRLA